VNEIHMGKLLEQVVRRKELNITEFLVRLVYKDVLYTTGFPSLN
jgi:hypothetical protein